MTITDIVIEPEEVQNAKPKRRLAKAHIVIDGILRINDIQILKIISECCRVSLSSRKLLKSIYYPSQPQHKSLYRKENNRRIPERKEIE